MKKEILEQIEDILRAYEHDVLSNMVIEQILLLLGEMEMTKLESLKDLR